MSDGLLLETAPKYYIYVKGGCEKYSAMAKSGGSCSVSDRQIFEMVLGLNMSV